MFGSRRAQVVLAAAVVVAAALAPMLVAYLQLGHPVDAAVTSADRDDLADARRSLDRATTRAAEDARGVAWANRSTAVRRLNRSVGRAAARLERRGAARDRTYRVAANATVARRVARADCPRGPRRAFGPCVAAGGVAVQERAGETAVVAVALDVRVRSPRGTTRATVVLRPRA